MRQESDSAIMEVLTLCKPPGPNLLPWQSDLDLSFQAASAEPARD